MKSFPGSVLPLLVSVLLSTPNLQADWPTFRHDRSRVGYTAEPLPAPLGLRWVNAASSPPRMAWPDFDTVKEMEGLEQRRRVRFDDVFNVAIAGNRLWFGSSVDNQVRCLDLTTGRELWSFFTDGPVRLAPTYAEGRVYFGSDDGAAYCLDAATGSPVWRLQAGPRDERILARGRMTSRWPVRTGVLVDQGTAYFGAGTFPHENIYLYAVEAATGKVIWRNDAISQEDAGRSDIAPQGYLLASDEHVFVPSGRALSVVFDRKTGEMLTQPTPGWRSTAGGPIGGTEAFLADDQIYAVGENQILAMDQDGGKTGFGWFHGRQLTLSGDMGYMANGKEVVAIDRIQHAEGTRVRHKLEQEVYQLNRTLRSHPAKGDLSAAQSAQRAVKDAQARVAALVEKKQQETQGYRDAEKALLAARDKYDRAAKKYESRRKEYQALLDKVKGLNQEITKYDAVGVKWSLKTPLESSLVLAGTTLVLGGHGRVQAIDVSSGKEVWSAKVDGEARGLAAVKGRLVVSTTSGRIYGFQSGAQDQAAPVDLSGKNPFPKDSLTDLYAEAAEAIVANSGVKQGFCLVLGSEQGRLAYEIAKRTELQVQCLETDLAKVETSRRALTRSGLYGSRITVDHLDLSVVPYPNYFANLVVSDTFLRTGKLPLEAARAARTLKPLGGVLCLGLPARSAEADRSRATEIARKWMGATRLTDEGATVRQAGSWTLLTRGALPGADSWSHQYGNAANTSSNRDQRVKDGLSVLWYGDPGPEKMVNRHAGAVGPVSVNGRLFIQGDTSVMAYDAYNGLFLWEVDNPGAMRTGLKRAYEPGNMAASDDSLFMVNGQNCVQLDAATGKIRHLFSIPDAEKRSSHAWGYIAYQDGVLFGTTTDRSQLSADRLRRGQDVKGATDTLFAYDVKTRKRLWTYDGKSISHVSIAIGDGRVFFIDSSLTADQRTAMLKQDKSDLAKLKGREREIAEARQKELDLRLAVAIEAKTGKQIWAKPVDVTDCSDVGIGGGSLTLIYHNGHVILGGANANGHYWKQFLAGEFERRRLVVLDANFGEKLWAKDANYRHRPIVIENEIIAEPWAYDLYTGEQKMRTHPLTGEQTAWKFIRPGHHCGAISATPSMMFFRSKSTAFYNLEEDNGTQHFAGQRLGCWINSIPANGLLMIPEASAGCVCLFSIASTIVFEPHEDRQKWGVYSAEGSPLPVRHMALNLGGPGDRRDGHGKLWLGYPRPSSRAGLDLPLSLSPKHEAGGGFFDLNEESFVVKGHETPWLFASGARGLTHLELPLQAKDNQEAVRYTVRLYLASQADEKPGSRMGDIQLQGKTVATGVDAARRSGGAQQALVLEFSDIEVTRNLVLEVKPGAAGTDADHLPVICGIEVLRTGSQEITKQVAGR